MTQCDHCFHFRPCVVSSGSWMVVIQVFKLVTGLEFPSSSQFICQGETAPPHQGLLCRDWSYYIPCFTIKDIMTRKENHLAKTGFYKLQHLKPIIQLYVLVIDRIFVWVFLPHLLDPVNSHYAASVSLFCLHQLLLSPSCHRLVVDKLDFFNGFKKDCFHFPFFKLRLQIFNCFF